MAIWTFEAFDEIPSSGVPHTNALIERARCDILGVGRDGNGCNAVFNAEDKDILTCLNVPQADSAITTAGSDGTAITGKIERVDVLIVTSKCVPDASRGNIPYLFTISVSRKSG